MAFCPECNIDLGNGVTKCFVCGHEISNDYDWFVVGYVDDKLSADFVREAMNSYEIPVVVISKSGFFGNIGLPLTPFYKPGESTFEVMVPREYQEDAEGVLTMILGEKWRRRSA